MLGRGQPHGTRLGEGRGGVKECLAIAHEARFAGPLVIENYVAREMGMAPMEELRHAKAFIDATLDELARPNIGNAR